MGGINGTQRVKKLGNESDEECSYCEFFDLTFLGNFVWCLGFITRFFSLKNKENIFKTIYSFYFVFNFFVSIPHQMTSSREIMNKIISD